MEEDDDIDDIEWDKPQDFVDQGSETKVKDGQSAVQRGIAKTSHPRVILHIDIDCFYAQVEMIRNPVLRNKPLGIQQKYIVVTCNYPAREYGVTKLMSIKDAKEKCPNLVLVNGEDLTHYRHMSYKISEYLQQYCPKVERLGFDENFLDITDLVNDRLSNQDGDKQITVMGHVYGEEPSVLDSCSCGCRERLKSGSHIAAEIRDGLYKELGITCCGGIASNKLLSKLVAGSHKPNQQTTLFPESTGALMGSLKSVRNIPGQFVSDLVGNPEDRFSRVAAQYMMDMYNSTGIGHSSSKQLQELGVVSVRDLQDAELSQLKRVFGEVTATHMQQLAYGIDESQVMAYSLPQTLSDEDSFKKCCSVGEVEHKIKELLNSLLNRLLEDGRTPATLRLTVRKLSAAGQYLARESRQCPIPSAVFSQFSKERILQTLGQLRVLAMVLFNKLVDTKQPFHLTLINVAFAKMEEKSKNSITNFFSPKSTRKETPETSSSDVIEVSISNSNANATESLRLSLLPKDVVSEEKACKEEPVNIKAKTVNSLVKNSGKRNSLTKWLSTGKDSLHEGSEAVVNRSDSKTKFTDKILKRDKPGEGDITLTDKNVIHNQESINNERNKTTVSKRKSSMENNIEPETALGVDNSPKRQRLMENFDDLIPEHIDKAVFYQLPPVIQQEILSSPKMVRDNISDGTNDLDAEQTMGIKNTAKMKICETKDRNLLDIYSIGEQGTRQNKVSDIPQATERTENVSPTRTSPKPVKSPNTEFFKSKAMKRSGMKADTRFESDKDSLASDKDKHLTESTNAIDAFRGNLTKTPISDCDRPGTSKSDNELNTKSDIFIPPDVDKETFLSLPSDIQQELISEWKSKASTVKKPLQSPTSEAKATNEKKRVLSPISQTKGPSEKTAQQTPTNRPFHFKMPEKSPHNNILSYFPKANK